MRIYKADGSFTENPRDVEFGWNFSDFIVDENVPNYEERNQETRNFAALRQKYGVFESVDSSTTSQASNAEYYPIQQIETSIPEHKITSVTECCLQEEGVPSTTISETTYDPEKIADLVTPANLEAKVLYSVVSFARKKSLSTSNLNDVLFFKNDKYNSMLNVKDFANFLIDNDEYYAKKDDNMLSLLMDIITTDNISLLGNQKLNVPETKVDLQSSVGSSTLGDSVYSEDFDKSEPFLSIKSEVLSSLGFCEDVDRSLQSFCDESYELQVQIATIKHDLQVTEKNASRLLVEARNLRKDLKETTYLDELLKLLNGKTSKINMIKLPFKLLMSNNNENSNEMNLIV